MSHWRSRRQRTWTVFANPLNWSATRSVLSCWFWAECTSSTYLCSLGCGSARGSAHIRTCRLIPRCRRQDDDQVRGKCQEVRSDAHPHFRGRFGAVPQARLREYDHARNRERGWSCSCGGLLLLRLERCHRYGVLRARAGRAYPPTAPISPPTHPPLTHIAPPNQPQLHVPPPQ